MAVGQVGGLLPHVTFPAVMAVHLMGPWGLDNAEAGAIAGGYMLGYTLAVPVLTALTDRIDARRILAVGSAASALATIAFGLLAQGFWSALALWALAGAGFAGAYMPGLRALTDRLEGPDSSRSVTVYTASFSIGVGLSFLVAQVVADRWGWRAAFLATGAGPLVMLAVAAAMGPKRPTPAAKAANLLDFRPVLRNRPALGYILGYGAHCFELYGMRAWLVPFWIYVVAREGSGAPLDAKWLALLVTVLSLPASLLGNEAALRFGRHRAIGTIQVASAGVAVAIGLAAGVAPVWAILALLVLYGVTVPADSGSLTSGMVGAAAPDFKGATMAVHSTVGFATSAGAAYAVGVALDGAGGAASGSGWLAAFCVLAAGISLGPLALWWSRRAGPGHA
ncbi:MAG: MFS transporter [Rhodospirillales bacterium]|nr:MAG: MFS transporter [Rhodospirillales bacterium]